MYPFIPMNTPDDDNGGNSAAAGQAPWTRFPDFSDPATWETFAKLPPSLLPLVIAREVRINMEEEKRRAQQKAQGGAGMWGSSVVDAVAAMPAGQTPRTRFPDFSDPATWETFAKLPPRLLPLVIASEYRIRMEEERKAQQEAQGGAGTWGSPVAAMVPDMPISSVTPNMPATPVAAPERAGPRQKRLWKINNYKLPPPRGGFVRGLGLGTRSVLEGLGSIPEAFISPFNTVNHWLGGSPDYFMSNPGRAFANLVGLPNPETDREKMFHNIQSALASLPVTMGAGAFLQAPRAASMLTSVPSIGHTVGASLTSGPGMQMASSAMAGAAVGQAQNMGLGKEAQMILGMLGGAVPSSIAAAKSLGGQMRSGAHSAPGSSAPSGPGRVGGQTANQMADTLEGAAQPPFPGLTGLSARLYGLIKRAASSANQPETGNIVRQWGETAGQAATGVPGMTNTPDQEPDKKSRPRFRP